MRTAALIAAILGLAEVASVHAAAVPAPPASPPPIPPATPPSPEVSAPPPAPAPPPTAAPPAPPPAPATPTPAAPSAECTARLTVGEQGFWMPAALFQVWFDLTRAQAESGGAYATQDTFRIRRAELHWKGEILPGRVAYAAMIDPAKVLEPRQVAVGGTQVAAVSTRFAALQDAYLTYLTTVAEVSVGQTKIPISLEGSGPSAKLIFPERSLVAREYGDRRDLGVRVAKTFARFAYSASLWNGAEANRLDDNSGKDGALRLELYPIAGLTVAGLAYASLWDRAELTKDRYEGDLRWDRGPLLVQGEYIYGRDRASGDTGVRFSHGFYGVGAVQLPLQLQAALRFGMVDRDVDLPGRRSYEGEVGLTWYAHEQQVKLQAAYVAFREDLDAGGHTWTHEVTAAVQVAFP